MSQNIPVWFNNQYQTNLEMLLQQMGSKLEDCVRNFPSQGKGAALVHQVGAVETEVKSTRHTPTPQFDTPHAKRWAFPRFYHTADLIDRDDDRRILLDPQNQYAEAQAMALGRDTDDEIIQAMDGGAKTGEDGGTTTSFPAGNIVDAGATTGMTVAKVQEAHQILMENEVDVDREELFLAMSPRAYKELLEDSNGYRSTSSDFINSQPMVNGVLRMFFGFNIKVTTRLGVDANSDRKCLAWAKSGVGLATWDNLTSDISIRNDLSNATQVYSSRMIGATRLQEGKVVVITADET